MVVYIPMSHAELQSRVSQLNLVYGVHTTTFGKCLIIVSDFGICHISFNNDNLEKYSLCPNWHNANFKLDQHITGELIQNILNGKTDKIKILCVGTKFQHDVWKALLKIPAGNTTSYEHVAEMIGKPKAVRAVASAIARNNIAYIIPCHRVISKSGKINNYRWGVDIKRNILFYENPALKSLIKL